MAHTCNPSVEEERQEGPWSSVTSQPSLFGKVQDSEIPCLKIYFKKKEGGRGKERKKKTERKTEGRERREEERRQDETRREETRREKW